MIAATIILVVVLGGHYRTVGGRHVNRLLESMASLQPGAWRLETPEAGPQELRQIQQGIRALGERMAEAEAEIEDRIARERALAEQLEYQEKVAMIGRVAGGGVAHELGGAPLNVIQGRARILARAGLEQEQQRHLDDIEHQVDRMTMIIQQLLDCFRHVPESRRPVNLADILEDVVTRAREDRRCQAVSLQADAFDRPMPTRAEPLRVGLACLNVVRNACQAGREQVALSVGETGGEFWVFRVEDDGPGIPAEHHARVFEPFFSTRPAGEGTGGLGLAVVQSVMKEHGGGSVEVIDSELGGCGMALYFPKEVGQ